MPRCQDAPLQTDPWVSRLEAAAAGAEHGGSDALRAVIADPLARAGTWALMLAIALLVFLMVAKPSRSRLVGGRTLRS